MPKYTPNIINDLEEERKYDSYVDEYKRMVTFGTSIIIPSKTMHKEIWDYTLDLLLKSFKPPLFRDDIISGSIIKRKNINTEVLDFEEDKIIALKQKGNDGTIKKMILTNMGKPFLSKNLRIDYSVSYKAPTIQVGLKAAVNKHVMKKQEKIRAANIAKKICNKFKTPVPSWVKKYAQ